MTKILVGGVGKTNVAEQLKKAGDPDIDIVVTNDMDAAMKLRAGQADYFLGTCHTGAGGSLGVLVGLLGKNKCFTFGRGEATADKVATALDEGRVAFGFSIDQADQVVPAFVKALQQRRS